jgi:hypothetical protein
VQDVEQVFAAGAAEDEIAVVLQGIDVLRAADLVGQQVMAERKVHHVELGQDDHDQGPDQDRPDQI